MKKVVIVHCWDGYPEYCWYPRTKNELDSDHDYRHHPDLIEEVNKIVGAFLEKYER